VLVPYTKLERLIVVLDAETAVLLPKRPKFEREVIVGP
jgi:hypothetical protein